MVCAFEFSEAKEGDEIIKVQSAKCKVQNANFEENKADSRKQAGYRENILLILNLES